MAVQSSIGVKRVVFEEVAELDTVGFGNVVAAVVGNAQELRAINRNVLSIRMFQCYKIYCM